MKKGLTILMLAVMLLSCENETSYEAYPQMGEFYTESCGLKEIYKNTKVLKYESTEILKY